VGRTVTLAPSSRGRFNVQMTAISPPATVVVLVFAGSCIAYGTERIRKSEARSVADKGAALQAETASRQAALTALRKEFEQSFRVNKMVAQWCLVLMKLERHQGVERLRGACRRLPALCRAHGRRHRTAMA
jgi:hypothetical protein